MLFFFFYPIIILILLFIAFACYAIMIYFWMRDDSRPWLGAFLGLFCLGASFDILFNGKHSVLSILFHLIFKQH